MSLARGKDARSVSAGVAPLRLVPALAERVWGGRRLERWGKDLGSHLQCGESWEFADVPAEFLSNAAPLGVPSRIATGPFAGLSVRDADSILPNGLFGRFDESSGSPILFKLLDACENLSVQVHPSADYAACNPSVRTKTESWVVLDATPGALVYAGVKQHATLADVELALRAGMPLDVLTSFAVSTGDVITLPSGIVHALGSGILIAEIQSSSDTTFRLYDWAREYSRLPRELHLDEGLRAADFGLQAARGRWKRSAGEVILADTDRYQLVGGIAISGSAIEIIGGCLVFVVAGAGNIGSEPLARGDTWLVPAGTFTQVIASADSQYLVMRPK